MMKKTLTLAIAAAIITSGVQARTWTSSDGTKTFQGTYVSQKEGYVIVTRGFKDMRFKISLLSEADQQWLKEKQAEDAQKKSETSNQSFGKIGTQLNRSLSQFDGTQYNSTKLTKAPQYYLVYFTASW